MAMPGKLSHDNGLPNVAQSPRRQRAAAAPRWRAKRQPT